LYDLAFLLMDLCHRGRDDLANLVFNRYLDENDELGGAPALPFFMAVRASIRAHVTATQARGEPDADERAQARVEAQAYFDLAERLLAPRATGLVAIGGFSGSGKSSLAAALAPALGPAPGARIVSSDRIRKRMHGVHALQKLPQEAYAPEISERVYAQMRVEAARALASGCAVVADAVFDRKPLAEAIENVARDARVPFTGLWLEAARDALAARVAARRNDPSDASVSVLDAQIRRADPHPAWRRLDAGQSPAQMLATARRIAFRT
ncbi:MAG: AAA family ATPase, partial [Hyphomicrobiales bacterium]|nr:AAA family ATPase [Hyphomicrobiales bacterium]